jgi:hypothetical protein
MQARQSVDKCPAESRALAGRSVLHLYYHLHQPRRCHISLPSDLHLARFAIHFPEDVPENPTSASLTSAGEAVIREAAPGYQERLPFGTAQCRSGEIIIRIQNARENNGG